jgi:ribonuclease HI
VWYKNWERNNWQTSLKKPVLNRDLVQDILTKTREREAIGSKTEFVWIKGHATELGNIAADRLAVMGAQMRQV